jgi:Phytanoyl-CoA dioxygenase (PhyH)
MVNSGNEQVDDPWDAFGDDNDDDDQDNNNSHSSDAATHAQKTKSGDSARSCMAAAADRVAPHLAKTFFWNKKSIKAGIKRRVGIVLLCLRDDNNNNAEKNGRNDDVLKQQETWETTLTARGFAVTFFHVVVIGDETMIERKDQSTVVDAMVFAWARTSTSSTMTTDQEKDLQKLMCCMQKTICPGGVLIIPTSLSLSLCNVAATASHPMWDRDAWKIDEAEMIYEYPSSFHQQSDKRNFCCLWAISKHACPIQSTLPTCTWLPLHYNVYDERQRVALATICLSAQEVESSKLVESSISQAVQALQEYGYCILPRLLSNKSRDLAWIHSWSRAALDDLHEAARILKRCDGVDVLNPHESRHEPASYREMSMREDYRMDLRHGPRLAQLRNKGRISSNRNGNIKTSQTANYSSIDDIDNADENDGNLPWIVKATTPLPGAIPCSGQKNDTDENGLFHAGYFLRGHVDILEIARRTMNPKSSPDANNNVLSRGNFGRYNFSGSGPDGSFQNLRVSPVGAIISLPGSADQAIHADIPHLFEHMSCLPAHYINVFTPGIAAAPGVGQTAFVHGSHTLEFCARFTNDDDDKPSIGVVADNIKSDNDKKEKSSWKDFLIRPALDLGDVLLFDCRILHFGLANSSGAIGGDGSGGAVERPLLYTNMTQHWFHDPKNWQDQRPIFEGI